MVKVHRQLLERVGRQVLRCCSTRRTASRRTPTTSPSKAQALLRDERRPPHRRRPLPLAADRRGWREDGAMAAVARGAATCSPGPGSPTYALRPVGRVAAPRAARRQARAGTPRGCGHLRQRRGPHARRRDGARVRDLQGRRSTPRWLDGLDLLGAATGLAGRRHPPLRQRRGRHTTTPGSATWASGGWRRWRPSCPTTSSCSASTSTPRSCSTSTPARASVRRPGRRDRAPPRPLDRASRRAPTWRSPTSAPPRRPTHRRARRATSRAPGRAEVAQRSAPQPGGHAADGRGAAAGGRLRPSRWPSGTRPPPSTRCWSSTRPWSSGRPTRRSPTSPTACGRRCAR